MSGGETVVMEAIDAFNARDVERFASLTTPAFRWLPSMSPIAGEDFVGPDGIKRYFDGLGDAWEHFRILPGGELRAYAAGLVLLGRLDGLGRGSGARVDSPLGMAFDLRNGQITRIRGFLNHAEALRAVGLE